MLIGCVWEHNGSDTLLYAEEFPGAFARGKTLEEACGKMTEEVHAYLRWAGKQIRDEKMEIVVVQEKKSSLAICDADSDVIFDSERKPLTWKEYQELKTLAMKSACDFQLLMDSVPDPDQTCLSSRETFYGKVPATAREMYEHTKNVNDYYFGEIGVEADHEGTIAECRERGFAALEAMPDFLNLPSCEGSYGEAWSVRKVLRRFIWHDRIHARGMWRRGSANGMKMENPFDF